MSTIELSSGVGRGVPPSSMRGKASEVSRFVKSQTLGVHAVGPSPMDIDMAVPIDRKSKPLIIPKKKKTVRFEVPEKTVDLPAKLGTNFGYHDFLKRDGELLPPQMDYDVFPIEYIVGSPCSPVRVTSPVYTVVEESGNVRLESPSASSGLQYEPDYVSPVEVTPSFMFDSLAVSPNDYAIFYSDIWDRMGRDVRERLSKENPGGVEMLMAADTDLCGFCLGSGNRIKIRDCDFHYRCMFDKGYTIPFPEIVRCRCDGGPVYRKEIVRMNCDVCGAPLNDRRQCSDTLCRNRCATCSAALWGGTCPKLCFQPVKPVKPPWKPSLKICEHYTAGRCWYDNCKFLHEGPTKEREVCLAFRKGRCTREHCRFSHDGVDAPVKKEKKKSADVPVIVKKPAATIKFVAASDGPLLSTIAPVPSGIDHKYVGEVAKEVIKHEALNTLVSIEMGVPSAMIPLSLPTSPAVVNQVEVKQPELDLKLLEVKQVADLKTSHALEDVILTFQNLNFEYVTPKSPGHVNPGYLAYFLEWLGFPMVVSVKSQVVRPVDGLSSDLRIDFAKAVDLKHVDPLLVVTNLTERLGVRLFGWNLILPWACVDLDLLVSYEAFLQIVQGPTVSFLNLPSMNYLCSHRSDRVLASVSLNRYLTTSLRHATNMLAFKRSMYDQSFLSGVSSPPVSLNAGGLSMGTMSMRPAGLASTGPGTTSSLKYWILAVITGCLFGYLWVVRPRELHIRSLTRDISLMWPRPSLPASVGYCPSAIEMSHPALRNLSGSGLRRISGR